MRQNVGQLDAYIRISGGLTLLGWGLSKKSMPAIAAGSMKVAEGVTRCCPMLYLLGLDTLKPDTPGEPKAEPLRNG
ncbi:MAG: Uncharacterized protein FD169_151 [Bacillota bacterium]|nr:MAG: Uncharacterized protein FD169_151 [Bacillota bacterium]MBS3949839.1 DUF2892 domain-containing protein [Peptococcaceae bacterium]